jgi:hypothetical protein
MAQAEQNLLEDALKLGNFGRTQMLDCALLELLPDCCHLRLELLAFWGQVHQTHAVIEARGAALEELGLLQAVEHFADGGGSHPKALHQLALGLPVLMPEQHQHHFLPGVQPKFCQQTLSRGAVGAAQLHNAVIQVLHSFYLTLFVGGSGSGQSRRLPQGA